MAETFRDLEFEQAVNKWREHYGQTIQPSPLIDASLTSTATVGDTTIFISTYDAFPKPPFSIQVGSEVMEVTRVGTHYLNVVRGAAGTIPISHYVEDAVNVF